MFTIFIFLVRITLQIKGEDVIMKKFWIWMKDKKYAFKKIDESINEKVWLIYYDKQMLIGYMIEYLSENGIFIGLSSNKGFEPIGSYYKHLKEAISNIK
jgi:hypothetical protein